MLYLHTVILLFPTAIVSIAFALLLPAHGIQLVVFAMLFIIIKGMFGITGPLYTGILYVFRIRITEWLPTVVE